MMHYRNNAESYGQLLHYIKGQIGDETPIMIGSDTAKEIKKAVTHGLIKIRVPSDDRQTLLETIFDLPESLIQAADADEFENRLIDLEDVWNIIKNNNLDNYRSSADFHDWFITYGAESFQEHLMAGVRNAAGYVNQDRSSRLFYNNDNKAIRFIHNNHVWASTLYEERQQIIKNYYSYQPPIRRQVSDFNIPTTSGRKPEKSSVRGSTTTPKSGRTSSITPKTKRGQKKQ
ncbi:unnamed protein product [Didymodactylos carnosus]|uniref:Uncharacterized protein n=1 Tax=Didymodactylos carnosus TaxID=1234261 RepID=A0A8S2EQ15_9BILA|nr:unnamed protein product [Didymodactylos carnosus]CAF4017592.1 unnamed protein product [Didymodactylos carnosus]